MHSVNRRCKYYCDVEDFEGTPSFIIRVDDEGQKQQLVFRGKSPRGNTWLDVQPRTIARQRSLITARDYKAYSQFPLQWRVCNSGSVCFSDTLNFLSEGVQRNYRFLKSVFNLKGIGRAFFSYESFLSVRCGHEGRVLLVLLYDCGHAFLWAAFSHLQTGLFTKADSSIAKKSHVVGLTVC